MTKQTTNVVIGSLRVKTSMVRKEGFPILRINTVSKNVLNKQVLAFGECIHFQGRPAVKTVFAPISFLRRPLFYRDIHCSVQYHKQAVIKSVFLAKKKHFTRKPVLFLLFSGNFQRKRLGFTRRSSRFGLIP